MEKILIVEDDIAFGTMIQTWLRKKGFEVEKATSVKVAIQVCEEAERGFDLVLSDLRLPDHDGIFLLQWMRKHGVQVPFIVMTSYAEIQNVVLAMKSGATDYVAKPFHPEILLDKIKEAIKTPKKQDSNATSADSQRSTDTNSTPTDAAPGKQAGNQASSTNGDVPKYLEGESEASRKLYSFVSLVAPTPMSVLILGASGTGKEYVARRIHELSTRANKPFFALDCGAIPKEVAASEFFGHVKGSFTGADQDKKGAFEIANGGTLFLDEMGNLNYEGQVQLLRALQERKIRPVGSNKEIDIDIRLVCATLLAQTINARCRISRSLVSSILYPYIIEDAAKFKADKIAKLSKILRAAPEEATQEEAVSGLTEYVRQKLAQNNLPARLKDLSITIDQLALCAEDAGELDLINTLPRSMTSDDLFDLLKLAF